MKTIHPFTAFLALAAIVGAAFALTSCSIKLGADGSKEATIEADGVGEAVRAIIIAK